jgi:hypothetical protein
MKVRTNRKRTLTKLSYNKTRSWLFAPILARSAKLKEKNDRIMAMLDKSFPEQKGIPCPTWI